jgi:hypothetical protein
LLALCTHRRKYFLSSADSRPPHCATNLRCSSSRSQLPVRTSAVPT